MLWRRVAALHEQYGPFVRIAPRDLSVRNPRAVAPSTARRQSVWRSAAQGGYNQRMSVCYSILLDWIHATNGERIDMAKWFRFCGFDVMGDLAFGKSFKMLETSWNHWAIDILDAKILPLALQLPAVESNEVEPGVLDIVSTLLGPLKGREVAPEEFGFLDWRRPAGHCNRKPYDGRKPGFHRIRTGKAYRTHRQAAQRTCAFSLDSKFDPLPDELAHLEYLTPSSPRRCDFTRLFRQRYGVAPPVGRSEAVY
ncbi:hypothetical protein TgHK011_008451 [Trichoderma gracile]|nr:hypothetical protein TgHK011_008451 [Trichoderma gracile]